MALMLPIPKAIVAAFMQKATSEAFAGVKNERQYTQQAAALLSSLIARTIASELCRSTMTA